MVLAAALTLGSCTREPQPVAATPAKRAVEEPEVVVADAVTVYGTWRATLTSPGGALPFGIAIEKHEGTAAAFAINGEERVPFSSATQIGKTLVLQIDRYDSEIRATVSGDGKSLEGRWTKTTPTGPSTIGLPRGTRRVSAFCWRGGQAWAFGARANRRRLGDLVRGKGRVDVRG